MATPEFRHNVVTLPPVEDDTVDLRDIVVHLWRGRWIIAIGTFSAALVGALGTLALPKTYEATATVFVNQPVTTTQDVGGFPIEGYGRVAESDYIRDLVRDRIQRGGTGAEFGPIRTVLYPSRETGRPFLPLFGLTAQSTTAEGAQLIANTWTQTLIEEQAKLVEATTAESVRLIVDEFDKTGTALADAERNVKELQDRQAAELAAMRTAAGIDPKPEGPIAVNPVDPKGAASSVNIVLTNERPALTGPKYASVQAHEQRVIVLEGRVAETRRDVETARARLAVLENEMGSQSTAAERAALRSREAELDALERALGVDAALATRMRADVIASEVRLEALKRAHEAELAVSERRVSETSTRFARVEGQMGEARAAETEAADPDIKIGALAPLPAAPIGPSILRNALIASCVGFVLALFYAWVLRRVA